MSNMEADLAARWAIELAKNYALRRCVGDAGCDTETARMLWSLGFITGKEQGLQQAQEIMSSKPSRTVDQERG